MSVNKNSNDKEVWFHQKKYGVGWGLPVTWQGWAVVLTYLILMIGGAVFLNSYHSIIPFYIVFTLIVTALFVFICWEKGEKPTLRWGKKIR